jgi:peptidoglycan/LPS O-acetylase OafA/YrhL
MTTRVDGESSGGARVQPPDDATQPDRSVATVSSTPAFGYLPAIDGLRALAVIAVLLFHGGVLPGGYLGVDAFFVVSGYLITSLMLIEVDRRGRLDLRAFWYRRVRRLFPALALVLLAVALYCVTFASRTELSRIRGDAIATVFYFANWRAIVARHGYWEMFQAPSPLEHTWSLAVEEQFYVLWPVVVAMLVAGAALVRTRRGRHRRRPSIAPVVFVVATSAAVASAVWAAALFSPARTTRVYLGTDTRIASILFGAALAAFIRWRGPVRSRGGRWVLEAAAMVAVVALGFAWADLDGRSSALYRGGLALCGVGVALVVAAVAHPKPGPIGRLLSWRPLVAVGLISYGLYLWHWPLFVVLGSERTGLHGASLLGVRLAATFAAATLCYLLVEGPVRRRSIRPAVLWPAAMVGAGACVGAILLATAGAQTAGPGPLRASQGEPQVIVGPDAATVARERRVLFVGDSVADLLAGEAMAVQDELGFTFATASVPGCLFDGPSATRSTMDGSVSADPVTRCEVPWAEGIARFDPGHVIVIYGNAAAFNDVLLDGRWVGPCDGAYQQWLKAGIERTLRSLATRADVRLAILAPAVGAGIGDANARLGCVNDTVRRVVRDNPTFGTVDLAVIECPGGQCRDTIDGKPFRIDPIHPSPAASLFIVREMSRQLSADPAG